MKTSIAIFALLGTPAMAEMTMTLDWPSQTIEGDQYQVEVNGYEAGDVTNMWIIASPNDTIDLPLGNAAEMCIFPYGNAQPIADLRGPFHDEIIPVVPDPATGKLCISLFAQASGTWYVEF